MENKDRELGMRPEHRSHILVNTDALVKCTSYNHLVTECVRLGLLSPVMRRNIEDLNGERHNLNEEDVLLQQHRRLFLKITKRGPKAYGMLIQALRNVGSLQAVQILEDVDEQFISIRTMNHNRNSTDIVDTKLIPEPNPEPASTEGASISKTKPYQDSAAAVAPFTDPVENQTRVVLKSEHIHTDKVNGAYTMQSKHNRGVLLMVNIIDFPDEKLRRNGAEVDGDSLIHIFREIGFTIFAYNNLNQEEFFDILNKVTSSSYVQETECFVMVLMTHGERVGEMDKVEFKDGSVADVHKIRNHFQAHTSPYLVHKPKVLIFPFCRGKRSDQGQNVEYDGYGQWNDLVPNHVPTLSDLLVAYASTPGYRSHRDPDTGSWYIQKFCDVMADNACDTHVEDILKKTHAEVGNLRTKSGYLQTGAFDNLGFNKKLYFNPGCFKE